jgi:hypothetical protein
MLPRTGTPRPRDGQGISRRDMTGAECPDAPAQDAPRPDAPSRKRSVPGVAVRNKPGGCSASPARTGHRDVARFPGPLRVGAVLLIHDDA